MTWRPSIGVVLLMLIGSMLAVVLASANSDGNNSSEVSRAATSGEGITLRRLLSFTDQQDGSVRVIDAHDRTILATVQSGEGAFLRGVLRTLTAERRTRGYDKSAPFELRSDVTSRLLLIDKATGTEILLNAFGPENTAYFKQFLSRSPSSANRLPVSWEMTAKVDRDGSINE